MTRPPPRSTRTDPPCPYTTLFRSRRQRRLQVAAGAARTVLAVGRTALARGRRGDRAALVGARCGRRLAIPGRSATPAASWRAPLRSEEHTSELQSLMRNSYAVFCLKKKKRQQN